MKKLVCLLFFSSCCVVQAGTEKTTLGESVIVQQVEQQVQETTKSFPGALLCISSCISCTSSIS